MRKDSSGELESIAIAVAHRKLAAVEIAALRASIEAVQCVGPKHRALRAMLRDLKVAATQLKTFQSKVAGPLDDDSFRALPPHLQRRLLARFNNLAIRLAQLERARLPKSKRQRMSYDVGDNSSFGCLREYERSRAQPDSSSFWCQIALVVCLLSCVVLTMRQHSNASK